MREDKREETIQTFHPTPGKTNKRIAKQKYQTMKTAMLAVLKNKKMTHSELFSEIEKKLKGSFKGNISWYAETVKLDLEARRLIARTSDKPQKYYFV